MSDDRRTTTVRLRETSRIGLERAAYCLNRSQTAVIEEALDEWLRKNKFTKRYQLTVHREHIVLAEIDADDVIIKDVQQRNGVSVEQIARDYSEQLNAPVKVIESKTGELNVPHHHNKTS